MQDREPTDAADANAAFEVSGHKAAVFKPRFGNAHQQYLCAV